MKHRSVKVFLLLASFVLAVCLLPVGCRAAYVWNADRAVKPVIREIEAFRSRTGSLPVGLSDLSQQTSAGKALKLEGTTDVGRVWSIDYQAMPNGSYVVTFDHVHYVAHYQNGKRDWVRFNFFR